MLSWLFRKRLAPVQTPIAPFHHGDALTLYWNADSEGWTCPFPELGEGADCHVGAEGDLPRPETCDLLVRVRGAAEPLKAAALEYLAREAAPCIQNAYKHAASPDSFRPQGVEVFEHWEPGDFALTFDPVFDEGAVWRVSFEGDQPVGWGFDD